MSNEAVRVGVLGYGNVGSALVELLEGRRDVIQARSGLRIEVAKIAVRDVVRARAGGLAPELFTDDPAAIVNDPAIDVVVEVMGGIDPARALIAEALAHGKPVVTANKELLAHHGVELYTAADAAGRDLLFEAAVAGGIPLIRPLRESLAGEAISRVMGIVNGTTNYILTKMSEEGATYAAALTEAQELGYAERDPTADVEGFDAGAKAAIIASIAFGVRVTAADVYHEGISNVTVEDIAVAHRLGYVVKLLAIAERDEQTGEVGVRVHPAMVPEAHPLATVRHSYNAVFVEGAAVGSLMFYGRGAGGFPTASAVLGDLIDAAVNLGKQSHAPLGTFAEPKFRPIAEIRSEYYLPLDVVDRPGVLHAVTGVFAQHDVSIRTAEQHGLGPEARLVFITHDAQEADVQATLHDLRRLDVVRRVGGVLRVVGA
ncbi:MAG: homoserine dehydrogenase [Acidimicrobiia bacterium]|nr:homoserine dehydrogenase [Acidimicrobiia bacterium]